MPWKCVEKWCSILSLSVRWRWKVSLMSWCSKFLGKSYLGGSVSLATGVDTGEERIVVLSGMESQFLSHVASCSLVTALRYPNKNKHFSSPFFLSSSLLLRWHYIVVQTFASLMDISQSAVCWPFTRVFNFNLLISVRTQFPLFFGHPVTRLPGELLLNT